MEYQTFFFEKCITIVNCELNGSLKAPIVYHIIVSGIIPVTTYSPVRNRNGVAIIGGGGGLEKVSKLISGGIAISWGWVEKLGWVGCYKWIWREDQHMHWINYCNFLNKYLLRLLHISSILEMCLSSSIIM